MHLLSKAKNFLHKPPTAGAASSKATQPKHTDPPRTIPRLEIKRGQGGRELKRRRPPLPAPTVWLLDIGSPYEDVHKCLQDIKGLDFRDNGTIVAVSKLSKEALDPIARAISILMGYEPREEGQLMAACTLIRMLDPSVRLALRELCPAQVDALLNCPDKEVREAMNRAFYVAGRDALCRQDFSQFLKLLSYCSPQTKASLIERFPPLTIEMVQALDGDALVEAVRLTVERVLKLEHPEMCLTELDSLLSIAGNLQGPDLPRAVVMKTIIWPVLDPDVVPDPAVRSMLIELRYRALLPELTPNLRERIPVDLQDQVMRVVEEQQEAVSRNFKVDRRPGPETPFHEFFDFLDAKDAGDLNKAARLIRESRDEKFRAVASEELFATVSQSLEQEAGIRIGSEPGQFIQALLERFGFPGRGDPRTQMIDALPMLCDADHSFVLDFVLSTDQGKQLVAQAVMDCLLKQRYGNAIIASLVMALADRVDLQSIFLKETGPWALELRASVTMKVVIDLLASGVPHEAEAAAKILSLAQRSQGSEIARESLRRRMRDELPKLCEARPAIELDFILRTELGERLVAQAVVDCLMQGELDDAAVALLFKTLAHRVDLRSTDMFSIDPSLLLVNLRASIPIAQQWSELFKRLKRVQLDKKCTRQLNQWSPGWRLLLLPCLEPDLFANRLNLGIYSILSVKAIDAVAAGALEEKMNLAALGRRIVQQTLKVMLGISVADKPLLSDDALVNVMRAIMSDKGLAEETFTWAEKELSLDGQMKVYKAMAHALIRLQDDLWFDDTDPANHAVAHVAALMAEAMRTMKKYWKEKFQKEEWWDALVSRKLVPADLAPEIRIL